MTRDEAVAAINLRFQSGNSVPVTRAAITAEEWEVLSEPLDWRARFGRLNKEMNERGLCLFIDVLPLEQSK